jgi:hypothetical protein
MSAAWPALLGTAAGGALALAGAFSVELRKDRRRQLGAARLMVSQLRRVSIELEAMTEDEPAPGMPSWHEGPHHALQTGTWDVHAADFVARLDEKAFELVDYAYDHLAQAADWGFTYRDGKRIIEEIAKAEAIITPFSKPTWFDRHIWRL